MDENQTVDTELDLDIDTDITESDTSTLTEADYFKLKERNEKAEKLLVELKKQNKELKTKVPQWEYITKTELELENIVSKEPELEEYRNDILEYTKKGLSVKEAAILVKNWDKALENRKKANDLRIAEGANPTKTSYSLDELEKLDQSTYNKIRDKIDKGEITIK